MEPNIFSPRLQPTRTSAEDNLSNLLRSLATGVLTAVFGLLPILFIPGIYVALGFTKVVLVVGALFVSAICLSLAVLRSGRLNLYTPAALALFWGLALVGVASAFLSGDKLDALLGSAFEITTAGFLVLLALVMTFSMSFGTSKAAVSRVFMLLGVSVFVLQIYHLLRLAFGAEFLSFDLFSSVTDSPFGSFNDLAIICGAAILIIIIVAEYTATNWFSKLALAIYTITSLLLLAVINFYIIWLVLGFASLLMVLYLVSRDTWLRNKVVDSQKVSKFVLALVATVCVVSGVFVMSGNYINTYIGQLTGVNYLEVRPSVDTTINIANSVWHDNALLGVGPNRFEDAWRAHKDLVINQTVFWNTNFTAGSGYVPTLMVTTGIAGALMVVLFFAAFLYLGYRSLFLSDLKDGGWYVVSLISFVSSLYLWGMAIVYVPGATTLLLTAFTTGLTFAAYATAKKGRGLFLDVTENRQYGLFLIAVVLVLIITTVLSTINFGKQYLAGVTYSKAVKSYQTSGDYNNTDNLLIKSFTLHEQDLFVAERSQLRLIEIQKLSTAENTTLNQQKYTALMSEGITLAEQAISLDPTNPNNYRLLIGYYSLLNPEEFTDLKARVIEIFARMRELDHTNPVYFVEQAQYEASVGDLVSARASLTEAVKLKGNYTDALFLLSKIDIEEGKVENAIALTSAIISIEPNNPTRYFQLGVLLASNKKTDEAISSLKRATELDTNYADARYFLALALLEKDRKEEALEQLYIIRENNRDNTQLNSLITEVEAGNYKKAAAVQESPVEVVPPVTQDGDVTTTTENPETDLLTPVNRPAEGGEDTVSE